MRGIKIVVGSPIVGSVQLTDDKEITREIPPGEYFGTFFGRDETCIHANGSKVFIGDVRKLQNDGCVRIGEVMNKSKTVEYGRWHKRGYVH